MEVVIPEIARDVEKAEILALLVRVGQHVLAEQPVLELEAGEDSFELPSPATGRIEQILVAIGDDVQTGDVVLKLRTIDERPGAPELEPSPRRATLERAQTPTPYVRASPSARRRARELGVDLDELAAEHDGRVTVDLVESRAGGTGEASMAHLAAHDHLVSPSSDPIQPAAVHDTIDVTALEAARRRYRDQHDGGPRLTLTTFVVKACAIALREHPRMNSNLIRQGRALAIKRYVHVGVAVCSDRDRPVPVLADADRRPLCELAGELEALANGLRRCADGHAEPATFSIVNIRSFAGVRCTPIIYPPQVGALGLCRARSEAGRTLLPVSLAFDPRVNDEVAARRFLAALAELLADPIAMLMRS